MHTSKCFQSEAFSLLSIFVLANHVNDLVTENEQRALIIKLPEVFTARCQGIHQLGKTIVSVKFIEDTYSTCLQKQKMSQVFRI